jgi:hypothetical protein
MEPFLASLRPSIRDEVLEAVNEVGEERLRRIAMLYYVDVDRMDMWEWPTEMWTAEMIALQFLREVQQESERYEQITRVLKAEETYSSGALTGVIAGVVGAGAAVAGSKGLLLLGSKVAQRHWLSMDLDYTNFRSLAQSAIAGAILNTTKKSNWKLLGMAFSELGFDSQTWENQVAVNFQNALMSNLVGILGRAAWSGQRQVLEQLPKGMTLPDFQEAIGPWARGYAARLVRGQSALNEQAARRSMNRFMEAGMPPQTIGQRLALTFGLTDRDALAVDNYRRRLQNQRTKGGLISRLVNAHANRLINSHADRLARTEVMVSINFGQQMMWEKAMADGLLPVDIEKMWVTAKDEKVCPVCRPMDRTRTALMAGFDTSSGNVLVPPAHANCRCLVMLAEPRIVDWGSTNREVINARVFDSVGKREIKVRSHERAGRNVDEHTRRLRDAISTDWISDGLKRIGIERDGELSSTEKVTIGILAAAAAMATRGALKPSTTWTKFNRSGVSPELRKLIESTYAGKFGDMTVDVTRISVTRQPIGTLMQQMGWLTADASTRNLTSLLRSRSIVVEGVVSKAGQTAGRFDLAINPKKLEVWHDSLHLSAFGQNQGFANQWAGQIAKSYMDNGIKRVSVNTSDVGGYAWAKMGFNWRNGKVADDVIDSMKAFLNNSNPNPFVTGSHPAWRNGRPSQAVLDEVDDMLRRASTSNPPTPQQIANLPVGKDILIGTNWTGTMNLADAAEQFARSGVAKMLDVVARVASTSPLDRTA